jgi:hypothetical protein
VTGGKASIAASVAARPLHRARQTGDDYQTLLTSFCFERFLHRMGSSEVRDRFVLKGAMLLRLWTDQPCRATRDLDLLRKGDGSADAIRRDLEVVCAVPVEPDGVAFDAESIRMESIRAEGEYAGTRAHLSARSGSAHLTLQIDMGVGDAIWPPAQRCTYPGLLDFPAAEVLAYPREAVVAEKLEAMILLGDRNSRIKDFFDLHYLASNVEFDRATLAEAARRTFERRATPIPTEAPIGLTPAYWENPSRPAQVRAFARRAGLVLPDDFGVDFSKVLGAFLLPILDDLLRTEKLEGTWPPGGPWQRREEPDS